MKKITFIVLLIAGTSAARAQQQAENSNLNGGFWVVENNLHSLKKQTVKFYDSNLQLLYQEYYDRKQLNFNRKRVSKMLNTALAIVLKTKNNSSQAPNLVGVIKYKH